MKTTSSVPASTQDQRAFSGNSELDRSDSSCPIALLMQIAERLDGIEKSIASSVEKEAYTTVEVADRLGRTPWTVRQWCNKGQAEAKKIPGRGRDGEWKISHRELERLQKEGKLPPDTFANGKRLK